MFKNLNEIVLRGNVVGIAVAVIIGNAILKIIDSLVNNILMPPIGVLLGGVDFSNMFVNLTGAGYTVLSEAQDAGAATLNYGLFINSVVNFLIISLAIFFLLKLLNSMKKQETEETLAIKECPLCLSTIPLKATRCPNCTSELPPAG